MFYIIRFALSWVSWFILADKTRWREILPVCIFASFVAGITDEITEHYPLWEYPCKAFPILPSITANLGTYIVVPYLFIQWLPKYSSILLMLRYWFMWTTFCLIIELIHIYTGHMQMGLWWNIYYSYLSDWILLLMFYQFHKVFYVHNWKRHNA